MELMELLLRMVGLGVIVELLIVSFNPLPDTKEKWAAKRANVIRRLCYYVACLLAAIWLQTL
jgi:hypothetical protein